MKRHSALKRHLMSVAMICTEEVMAFVSFSLFLFLKTSLDDPTCRERFVPHFFPRLVGRQPGYGL